MPAQLHAVGKTAHEAETYALAFLFRGLPEDYVVYANSWVAQRSGAIFELDAVVRAPHGIYVVEVKSFTGRIEGTDHDWFIPQPISSPLRVNRLTAQILKSELKRASYAASRVWVDGLVFLSHTEDADISGEASRHRVVTRKTLHHALTDRAFFARHLAGGRPFHDPDAHVADALHRLLTGVDQRHAPPRRVREYRLQRLLSKSDEYMEYHARHEMTEQDHVLRVYTVPWSAQRAQREAIEQRATWEAQVLVNVGRHRHIVSADPPFKEEIGVCLPLERFVGISLASWIERHVHAAEDAAAGGGAGASLETRIELWRKVATALQFAHAQGVVHRLLRPGVILVEDQADEPDVRVAGFDLAKQTAAAGTVLLSKLDSARAVWAAPEVVQDFHDASPRSDQFSLGALLGLLATGKPLFASTRELLLHDESAPRLSDVAPRLPHALADVAARMLARRPAERYDTVAEAIDDVLRAVRRTAPTQPVSREDARDALDPENLAPGTRLGSDYEIVEGIGRGGLSVVYLARHLVSGTQRALKVARADERAEEALRAEHEVLRELDHPNVVRVVDLSYVVPERLTLVMEHVEGMPLGKWILCTPEPGASVLRGYAEDLLRALAYLEAQGLTHKDLKPDNLILGPDALEVIDFSLVGQPEDAIGVGTALYRDPAIRRWDHAADRYAAALCLFELYVGAHAFDGEAPEPGRRIQLDVDEVDAPGLVAFFQACLSPEREERPASVAAMRRALLEALGVASEKPEASLDLTADERTPLDALGLSPGIVAALRREGVRTAGDLVAFPPARIRHVRYVGRKRARQLIALRERLQATGVSPSSPTAQMLQADLRDDEAPLTALDVPPSVRAALEDSGRETIAAVAGATRDELLEIPGVGPQRLGQLRHALQRRLAMRSTAQTQPLEALLDAVREPLDARQRRVLEAVYGFGGRPADQADIAKAEGVTQPTVSVALNKALNALPEPVLRSVLDCVEARLADEDVGGILTLDAAARALLERHPGDSLWAARGLVRLTADMKRERLGLFQALPGTDDTIVCAPTYEHEALSRFVDEALRLAAWPPASPEAARRSLEPLLPPYAGDVLRLAVRVAAGVQLTPADELFAPPLEARQALPYVLRRQRLPLPVRELRRAVDETFGDVVAWPDDASLAAVLSEVVEVRVEGEHILPAEAGGVRAPARGAEDPLPSELLDVQRAPEDILIDMLAEAASHGLWRMLVTPPERHAEIGPSIAASLGARLGEPVPFLSFEHLFLEHIEPSFERFAKAERLKALRGRLTREAEELVKRLLAEHGRPGAVVVLGDTAILERLDALHLLQRIFTQTQTGRLGAWTVVIPGKIQEQQPLFNETRPVFQLEGAVLPVR